MSKVSILGKVKFLKNFEIFLSIISQYLIFYQNLLIFRTFFSFHGAWGLKLLLFRFKHISLKIFISFYFFFTFFFVYFRISLILRTITKRRNFVISDFCNPISKFQKKILFFPYFFWPIIFWPNPNSCAISS